MKKICYEAKKKKKDLSKTLSVEAQFWIFPNLIKTYL